MEDEGSRKVRDADGMLFDWFKHLMSLSVLTLGGVLSLAQARDTELKKGPLILVLACIALAGVLAFTGAEKLVGATLENRPVPPQVGWMRKASAMFFGLGVGAFLGIYIEILT